MSKMRFMTSTALAVLTALPMTIAQTTEGWAQLDEIVVTTRKREENLQDLPLAVTAIGAQQLERTGTNGLEDITKFSPSFIFDQNSAQKDVRIAVRGLSATRGRSNVAFLVDGIDVTSEAIGTSGASLLTSQRLLSDVVRVEAVKGPQSALYGRAAFAGAINYVTKDAPEEFEGYVGGEIAEYSEYSVEGSVGGPIADNLRMMINGFYWDEAGQYSNSVSGGSLGGGEGWGGAVTINFEPTDTFDIKARFEYTDEQFNPLPRIRFEQDETVALPPGADVILGRNCATTDCETTVLRRYPSAGGAVLSAGENFRTGEDYEGNEQQLFRGSLVATWDIDAIRGTLTSLTGYVDSDTAEGYDWDSFAIGRPDTNLLSHDIFNETDTEIFSQELRYQSDFDGPIQVTLGGNYWKQDREFREFGILGGDGVNPWQDVFSAAAANGNSARVPRTIEDTHWSVYGMIEWEVNDQFKLTLENRYTDETFDESRLLLGGQMQATVGPFIEDTFGVTTEGCSLTPGTDCNTVARGVPLSTIAGLLPLAPVQLDRTVESKFNAPKVTAEYKPNEDVLLYLSVAQGVKPAGGDVLGGGNPFFFGDMTSIESAVQVFVDSFTFDSEKMWSYELGAKTNWTGGFGDLVLNGAFFFQDYTDKQVSVRTVDPVSGDVQRRTVNAGAAEVYGIELESVWLTPLDGLSISAGYTWLDTEYTEFLDASQSVDTIARIGNCTADTVEANTCIVDRSGNELERAPEHAFSMTATYMRPLANSDIDWFVEGDTQYQAERFADTDNVTAFDDYWRLNLRAGLEAEDWEVIVFMDNVTNDDTITSGSQIPDFSRPLTPSRSPFFVDLGIAPPKRQVGVRAKYRF